MGPSLVWWKISTYDFMVLLIVVSELIDYELTLTEKWKSLTGVFFFFTNIAFFSLGADKDSRSFQIMFESKYLKQKHWGMLRLAGERGEWSTAVNDTSILWVFIFSLLHPTPPFSSSSSSSHPPLFHTAVYSGDLSSTEGGISFPFPLCLFPPSLEKPPFNSLWAPDSSVLRRAHIPRQYPQHRNRLPPQRGMLISSPGFHQA